MINAGLSRFRSALLRDISDAIYTDDAGGIREEKFTEQVLEYLEEAGETEGAIPCREIRENSIGNRIHKINGYAISESHETIDLFITVFKGFDEIGRIYADDLKISSRLCTRFFQNVLMGKMEGIEETAPVYDFVKTISSFIKDVIRVNIYILSDMSAPLDPPESAEMEDIRIHYYIRDIEYLYRIHTSGSGKEAIIIDFMQKFRESIPCLPMPGKNEDYMSYLTVIPARILADIYQDYGTRLLEQNVRTFLQFRGDINKGIRDTILKKPHMFMAYNNGISATAESVELTGDQKEILSIKDFQIVNGGQTTASIFQTRKRFKTADIDSVCVQVKLTVISDLSKKSEIVSEISRYANTQNKVSEADLSSNHPFHTEMEILSRNTWTSADSGKNQSRWYYERARGQYNDELYNIDSQSQQKKWLSRNPKSQKFAKEDLARYYMSWEMKPWWVVRGRQKNFGQFMNFADELDTNQIFYEDLIARTIIFKTMERLYGTGAKAIGDLRYMVVPYTMSWLRYITEGRINFSAIWKHQALTNEFEELLFSMLRQVDGFMRDTAPGGLIGEWAKKEDCWKELKKRNPDIDNFEFKKYCYTEEEITNRYQSSVIDDKWKKSIEKQIKDIKEDGWIDIDQWGKATGKLDLMESNAIWRIVRKIENKKQLSDKDLYFAEKILKIKEESN
ncbi:hypothetical protein FACS189437_06490 [Bacteroidia bacterium]|nr:hypothetical protein FACS189437_06490 [Bacteroidia bacterium]